MRRPLLQIVLAATFLFLSSFTLSAKEARIHYSVSVDPASETFKITADIHGLKSDTMVFLFPVWAPGAYDIVNFGAFVKDLRAEARLESVGTLKVLRTDTSTFKIIAPTDHVRLEYVVDDIEHLDNSAWFSLSDINDSTAVAFAVGTALFGYPAGHTEIPHTVTFEPPNGWDLAVALDPVPNHANTFSAVNYDEFVDAPIQMGKFQRIEFEVKGIPHILTVKAPVPLQTAASNELVQVTKDVVNVLSDFFGEMPYKRYLFQFYLKEPTRMDESFGALEHLNSSTYLMPYYGEDLVATILQPVISHEYWHLWSPKRFHVDKLGPFDYQHGPQTTSLWFHEGLTEYYARLLLVRNDLRSSKDFLKTFGSFMQELYGSSQEEPITTLSAELTERPLIEIISLYTKGPVIGLLLDTEIRLQTKNQKSLDDAIKYFNKNYGDHQGDKEFGDDDIIPIIEKATGTELSEFYERFIAGTEPLPLDEMLPKIGLRPALGPEFGARLATIPEGWKIATIYRTGMAIGAGLSKEDVIVGLAVDNGEMLSIKDLGIPPSKFAGWLAARAKKESTLSVTYLRGGERHTTSMPIMWVFQDLELHPSPTEEAMKLRKSMLGF